MAFEVKEADGRHLGVLYMDFYTRASKSQGAWCGGYRDHKWEDGKEINPIVTVVCNFIILQLTHHHCSASTMYNTSVSRVRPCLQGLFSVNKYSYDIYGNGYN